MDKEEMYHIHSGMVLCRKKECNNAICSNMDGPRNYLRKTNITYIIYMWHF